MKIFNLRQLAKNAFGNKYFAYNRLRKRANEREAITETETEAYRQEIEKSASELLGSKHYLIRADNDIKDPSEFI